MPTVFIEGIPGTGKSTLAEKLCAMAANSGRDAKWYLEESHNHPVHPKSWRAAKSQDNFAAVCIQSWLQFVDRWKDQDTLHILEGSAFQSTVRFMMENRLPGIAAYYRRFEEVVSPLAARMIYFRPVDSVTHSEYICSLRGDEWSTKVSKYLAKTDYAVSRNLSGVEGMHQFWSEYADLCDRIVEQSLIPTKTIKFVPGEWERHMNEAATFLELKNCDIAVGAKRFNASIDPDT